MKTPRPQPAGWSLIEILVAVAIVATLACLAFPAVQTARSNAEQVQCTAKLKNLATAGLHWINDNNCAMPDAMFWRFPSETHEGSLLPYLGYTAAQLNQRKATPLSCPASFREIGPNADWNRSYSMNIYACGSENGQRYVPYDRSIARFQQVNQPSRMAFFMDGNFLAGGVPERKVGPASVETAWSGTQKTGFYDRHRAERANVVFMDGHVQPIARDEFPKGTPTQQRLDAFWGAIQ
jgi:prepilin-type N-terminal cleavage/methylation domain-containing protein/prepilin-type processing-associated H-X9-DG protein